MAVLLTCIFLMSMALSVLLPAWHTQAIREKEAELAFRGEQYAHAIALYRRQFPAYPTNIDQLMSGHFLRKKWKDPITGTDFAYRTVGANGALSGSGTPTPGGGRNTPAGAAPGGASRGASPGAAGSTPGRAGTPTTTGTPGAAGGSAGAGIGGVMSTSTDESILVYKKMYTHYNEWVFQIPQLGPRGGQGQGQGSGPGNGRNGQGQGPNGPGGGIGNPGAPGIGRPGPPGGGPGGRNGGGAGPGRGGR